MAIIYSYQQIEEVSGDDLLLISDNSKANRTNSASVEQLSDYVIDQSFNGTDTYIPVFDGVNSLINSALKQDSADTPTSVTVASGVTFAVSSDATVGGSLSVAANGVVNTDLTVGNDLSVGRHLDVTGIVDASQVRVENAGRPLVLTKNSSPDSHIALLSTVTGTEPAFIASRSSYLSFGGVNGYSSSNLNIRKSDGFVGINQKNPEAPLHVKKSAIGEAIRVDNGNIGFYRNGWKSGYIGRNNASALTHELVLEAVGDTNKIVFNTGGSERVRITGEGKVGIGTTVIGSNQKFKVQGSDRNLVFTVRGNLGVGVDNPQAPIHCSGTIKSDGHIVADKFLVSGLNPAPNTLTSPGQTGEVRFTDDYIYVCVDNDTWKRAAIGSGS